MTRQNDSIGTLPALAGGASPLPVVVEYGGSEDQAEELEAARIEEAERLDRRIAELEHTVESLRAELAVAASTIRNLEARRVESWSRSASDAAWY